MAKAASDYTDILIRKGILSAEQLDEARNLSLGQGLKLQDALSKLNYASATEVMQAIAEFSGMQFIDLNNVEIPNAFGS